jgi:hypothetical protein
MVEDDNESNIYQSSETLSAYLKRGASIILFRRSAENTKVNRKKTEVCLDELV